MSSPGISPYSPDQDGDDVIPNLPDDFCSFVYTSQKQVKNPLHVDFTTTDGTAAHVAVAILPHAVPFSSTMAVQARLPLQVVHAPDTVTPVKGTKALQLATFSIQ